MFAYCRNNPAARVDYSGTADVDYFDSDLNPATDEKGNWGKATTGGGSSNSKSSTTTIYRSVGPGEAKDIANTGKFRTTNTSMACKQFGFNYDETAQFGAKMGNSEIVSAEIPTDALSMFYCGTVDPNIFKSGTLTVYEELLDILNELIMGTIQFLG